MDTYYRNNPGGELDSNRRAATSSGTNLTAYSSRRQLVQTNIPPIASLVTTREKLYGTISLLIGIAAYTISLIMIFGFFLAPFLLISTFITHGLFLGGLRSNSIRISHEQLPELNSIVEEICSALQMPVPAVYVSNGEGMFNAFATRLLSRDFVVVYSNILEMAYEKGEAEVAFVLAHELGHVKRRHTKFRFFHYPATFIPFLGLAYSRACESTCDRIAAAVCPDGAAWGLVALAAGSRIYRRVSLDALYRQVDAEQGFWTWFHEILSTHPNLVKRIKRLADVPPPGSAVSQTSNTSLPTRFSRLRS
jgi:Zn-dependent protease with chaperone function